MKYSKLTGLVLGVSAFFNLAGPASAQVVVWPSPVVVAPAPVVIARPPVVVAPGWGASGWSTPVYARRGWYGGSRGFYSGPRGGAVAFGPRGAVAVGPRGGVVARRRW